MNDWPTIFPSTTPARKIQNPALKSIEIEFEILPLVRKGAHIYHSQLASPDITSNHKENHPSSMTIAASWAAHSWEERQKKVGEIVLRLRLRLQLQLSFPL